MSTNNAANNPTAASGKVLQGQGIGTASNFSTATYPSTATSTGTILRADGTNWAATTAAYPNVATSAGTVLRADGTNWVASTATFPNTATSAGTILRADGTNWVATTATYPATTTVNQLLYSSSTSVVGGLTTQNNGLLVTGNTGIPSILAGPGATGRVLQSNSAAAPSFSTATYPSTATTTGQILRADGTNWVGTTATYPNTAGTSGNVLTSDGTNWSSAAPVPGSASFLAYLSTTQSNVTGDGTGYKIVFDTAYFNVGTNYGTGTGNYTAPVTGSYCFYAMVTFTNIGVSTTVRGLFSGSSFNFFAFTMAPAALNVAQSVSCIIQMTAGDTMSFSAYALGTTKTVGVSGGNMGSGATTCSFGGYRIT